MSELEREHKIIILGTVGSAIGAEAELPRRLERYGFSNTEDLTPDYTADDYEYWLKNTGEYLAENSEEYRLNILAFSGGAAPGLSLYLRNRKFLNRAVLHSGKLMSAYAFNNPVSARDYRNLATSSEILQQDIKDFSDGSFLDDVLCTRGAHDEVISPDQSVLLGANGKPLTHEHTFDTSRHRTVLTYVMTEGLGVSVDFIKNQ